MELKPEIVIPVVSAAAALSGALFTGFNWWAANKHSSIAQQTLLQQTYFNLLSEFQKEYRAPRMLFAIRTLWDFYREHGPDKFVDKYEDVRSEEEQWVLSLDKHGRFEAERTTLHNQRRLVSQFYQQLANLYVQGILPREMVYSVFSAADLEIIPKILVPIENKLRSKLHNPPIQPLGEDCNLLRLYREALKD